MDQAKSRDEVTALETQMQQSSVNMVALSAGRADWSYFLWSGHSDQCSAEVKASGIDYLMEDSARFGKWAHVSAVIDVLAPLYIKSHPETAAISWAGVPSQNLVSTTELVDGEFGKELLNMVSQIAAGYPVNSITLTEMNYHVDGFGEKDKAAYIAYTSKTDWPRNADGSSMLMIHPSARGVPMNLAASSSRSRRSSINITSNFSWKCGLIPINPEM